MSALADLEPMRPRVQTFWRDLWARTALLGAVLVVAYFALWEIFERHAGFSAETLHAVHLIRGMGGAFMLGTWSFLRIRQARLVCDSTMAGHMSKLEERVRKRTHELEEARAFTELLFDSLRERIIVIDRDGRVVKANGVADDVAGTSLVGKRCLDVFPGCNVKESCFGCRAFGGPPPTSGPRVETRADTRGRIWELESIVVPDMDGKPAFVIEVGRDVTEPKSLEAQVRHQEKMASLGVLTAGFAHDMGNPLASLSTELELLEDEEDLGRIRESLGVLRAHVSRMSRTLREMVDFARRRRDEVADVSVSAAIADSARLVCHDPRWKKVELVVDVAPDVPPVRMVEDHLVLVLINLMLNAADAMPEGGRLTVSARRDDEAIELCLRDTGAGMSPEVLAKAKTPLYSTKGGRGTGLGLPVCDGIVSSMGGTLDLSSTPGKGTEVRIHLPIQGTSHE